MNFKNKLLTRFVVDRALIDPNERDSNLIAKGMHMQGTSFQADLEEMGEALKEAGSTILPREYQLLNLDKSTSVKPLSLERWDTGKMKEDDEALTSTELFKNGIKILDEPLGSDKFVYTKQITEPGETSYPNGIKISASERRNATKLQLQTILKAGGV